MLVHMCANVVMRVFTYAWMYGCTDMWMRANMQEGGEKVGRGREGMAGDMEIDGCTRHTFL